MSKSHEKKTVAESVQHEPVQSDPTFATATEDAAAAPVNEAPAGDPTESSPKASSATSDTPSGDDEMSAGSSDDSAAPASAATPAKPWTTAQRIMASLLIFIVLMAILMTLSRVTTVDWHNEPVDQYISTIGNDTSVEYDTTRLPDTTKLPSTGTYEVETISDSIDLVEPSTGAVQHAHILVRMPKGVSGGDTSKAVLASDASDSSDGKQYTIPSKLPAAVYMHGAGYGTADNSFGDVATDLASAGFVTLTVDKPVWNTTDVNRDYPGSAHAYDQCVEYLRNLSYVNSDKVGIYATSESAWIAPYVIREDGNIAFQVLLSPLVSNPRGALAFFVSQDFAIVGANPGYQSIVRRAFSADLGTFGLTNVDFNAQLPESYSVPTFVAYGSKDVMTPQVEGANTILKMAHQSGNDDVTIRNYPIGNHVLRIGDEAEAGTVLVDHYEQDYVDWAVGVTRGLEPTTPRVTGATIRQSIAVPESLTAHRGGTIYAVVIHVLQILMLLVMIVMTIVARIVSLRNKHRGKGPALGLTKRFKRLLLLSFVSTFGSLLLFFAALGQIVFRVVKLVWGSAPTAPGMIYWSWYAVQIVCAIVVFTWACVFAQSIEALQLHGYWRLPWAPRRPVSPEITDSSPFAVTRLGRAFSVVCMLEILLILLVLAFWGVFIYF